MSVATPDVGNVDDGSGLIADLGSQGTFISTSRHAPTIPMFGSMTIDDLRSWVADRWYEAFEGKRAETERLKTCELFWAGFHYTDPFLNRVNPVTNFCFATVETMHPILTEQRPRPEARPRDVALDVDVDDIERYASWKMDATNFDQVCRVSVRDILKYGYCVVREFIDYDTGLSYPRHESVFDYYPDPTATNDSEREYFFIAKAVSTRRLAALFPNAMGEIQPDNIASPGYDVYVRPYFQVFKETNRFDGPSFISANLFKREGETVPSGGTPLVAGTGQHTEHGKTTFVLQMYVRDYSKMPVTYVGDRTIADPDDPAGRPISVPHVLTRQEPCCQTGWRVITMTAGGTFLEPPRPLDPCYGGVNIDVVRMHEVGGRYWTPGVLDHLIPLQRQYNRRSALLARALELSANPPIKTVGNTGLAANQNSVDAGEILKLKPGSNMEYLTFAGPGEEQFEQQSGLKQDMQIVTGDHDSVMGKRPAGIEAASAIRELQNAASVRIRGVAPVVMDGFASVLEKLLAADGLKAKDLITYYVGGKPHSMDPKMLRYDVDIRWAEGTGMVAAKQDYEDRLLDLFDRGIVDAQYVIEAMDLPGGPEVAARVAQMQQQQLAAQAAGAAKNAPPPRGK